MAGPPNDFEQSMRSMIMGNARVKLPPPSSHHHHLQREQASPQRRAVYSQEPASQWAPSQQQQQQQQQQQASTYANPARKPNHAQSTSWTVPPSYQQNHHPVHPPPGFHSQPSTPAHPDLQDPGFHHVPTSAHHAQTLQHPQVPSEPREFPSATHPHAPSRGFGNAPAPMQPQHRTIMTSDQRPNPSKSSNAPVRQPELSVKPSRGRGGGAKPSRNKPSAVQSFYRTGFYKGSPAQDSYLQASLDKVLPSITMSSEEERIKDQFRQRIEAVCRKAAQERYPEVVKVDLPAFGSFASGFGSPGSDMDLALVSPGLRSKADFPRLLERALLDEGIGARLLTRTRVPIVKICERPTPELLAALLENRQKWEDMTPAERAEHDSGQDLRQPAEAKKPKEKSPKEQTSATSSPQDRDGEASNSSRKPEGTRDDSTADRSIVMEAPAAPTEPVDAGVVDDVDKTNDTSLAEDSNKSTVLSESSVAAGEPHTKSSSDKQAVRKILDEAAAASFKAFMVESTLPSDAPNKSTPQFRKEKPWLREKALGPLDFPKSDEVGIQCDVNFSTTLGLHNTAMLRCYGATDPRVKPIVLYVKRWASRRKINSGYNGTLSSYGFVLMVLHYLVNVAVPPVSPNLQLDLTHTKPDAHTGTRRYCAPNPNDAQAVVEGYDVRFWRNEGQIRARAAQGLLSHNRESAGSLLRGFFQYFAKQGAGAPAGGFAWTQDVLALRTPGGLLSKRAKGWTGAKREEKADGREVRHRYLAAIEDPFEWEHNVARTVTHHGIVAIRDEFRRVARILDAVDASAPPEDILDELVQDAYEPPPAARSGPSGATPAGAAIATADAPAAAVVPEQPATQRDDSLDAELDAATARLDIGADGGSRAS